MNIYISRFEIYRNIVIININKLITSNEKIISKRSSSRVLTRYRRVGLVIKSFSNTSYSIDNS